MKRLCEITHVVLTYVCLTLPELQSYALFSVSLMEQRLPVLSRIQVTNVSSSMLGVPYLRYLCVFIITATIYALSHIPRCNLTVIMTDFRWHFEAVPVDSPRCHVPSSHAPCTSAGLLPAWGGSHDQWIAHRYNCMLQPDSKGHFFFDRCVSSAWGHSVKHELFS